jgi:peptide/nickel transport system permease protein
MLPFILRRLATGIVVILTVLTIIFILVRLTGDPAAALLPDQASAEDYKTLFYELGLDRPLYVQYIVSLKKFAVGDFGISIRTRVPVRDTILERLPNSLKLSAVSILIMLFIALPLGVMAAVKRGKFVDWGARVIVALGQSLPVFWLSLILMQVLAVQLRLLPVVGMGGVSTYILPAFCLALYPTSEITRLLRSSMLEVLDSDYVKMARIKGVSEAMVIWKHAFRNAILSVVTLSALYVVLLAMGAVVVETIFCWPGIGRMLWDGVLSRDFNVVQAVVFVIACLVIITNLIVDIMYVYIDPRIRHDEKGI